MQIYMGNYAKFAKFAQFCADFAARNKDYSV